MDSKEFIYCNAGQHSPLWWKADTKSIKYLKPTAPAIGLVSEIEFKSKSIRFGKDDILLLYTDGLIEVRDQNEEEFSEARLSDYLKKNNHLSAPFFWITA